MPSNEPACFGKIPTYGEFVRVRASTPTMRSFDEWIRTGLHHARHQRPADWETAYDRGLPRRFLYWEVGPKAPNALVGVIQSSRDTGDRTYPFVVACEIPKRAIRETYWSHLPLQAESFFDTAMPLVRRAVEGELSEKEVREEVGSLSGVPVRPAVPREQKRYLKEATVGAFLESIFGHFDHSEKYHLFSVLFDRLQSAPPDPSEVDSALQFPLLCDVSSPARSVSFWLEVVRRILGDRSVPPTLFWTERRARGADPHLLFYFGRPAPRALLEVFSPSRADSRILRLRNGSDRTPAEAALAIPELYGKLLEREDLRLWEFLRRL